MRKLFFTLLLTVPCLGVYAQDSLTTLILIRHAERANDGTQDPDISEVGKQRAKNFSLLMKETKVDAIYSTNYKRTKNTAAPLSELKGVSVQSYEAMSGEAIDNILAKHKGETIVIVGHSNTTPWVVNHILGREVYKTFNDDDYDNVLVVTVPHDRKLSKVLWLNY